MHSPRLLPPLSDTLAAVARALYGNAGGARHVFHENVPHALYKAIIPSILGVETENLECVAHYTSIQTAVRMLETELENPGSAVFRMYDAATFRDPKEGSIPHHPDFASKIMEGMGIPSPIPKSGNANDGMEYWGTKSQHLRFLESPESSIRAYILSFFAPTDERTQEQIGDDLKLWRLYGDNGRGCSFKIPFSDIQSYHASLGWQSYWGRVRYITPSDGEIAKISKVFQKEFAPVANFLRRHGDHDDAEFYAKTAQGYAESFLTLVGCLYKDKQYEHENEFRLIRVPDTPPKVHFDFTNPFFVRPYIEGPSLKQCMVTNSVLTTGPAARLYGVAANTLRKMCNQAEIVDTIEPSTISYRDL